MVCVNITTHRQCHGRYECTEEAPPHGLGIERLTHFLWFDYQILNSPLIYGVAFLLLLRTILRQLENRKQRQRLQHWPPSRYPAFYLHRMRVGLNDSAAKAKLTLTTRESAESPGYEIPYSASSMHGRTFFPHRKSRGYHERLFIHFRLYKEMPP